MQQEVLSNFFLVGGTALSLQIGHRISVDLDLFTQQDFDTKKTLNILNTIFEIQNYTENTDTLNFNIKFPEKSDNIIKIDLIKYSYPLINPIIYVDDIRLLSVQDIIPMKLSAIAGRGSKKDFYDIYYLLKNYTFMQMFGYFEKKFPNANKFHVLKSLEYFADAELEPDPKTLEKSDWKKIKQTIIKETNKFIKIL